MLQEYQATPSLADLGHQVDLRQLEVDVRARGRVQLGAPGGAVDLPRMDVAAVVRHRHADAVDQVHRMPVVLVGALSPGGGAALDVGNEGRAQKREEFL